MKTMADDHMDELLSTRREFRDHLREQNRELREEVQALREDMNSRLRVLNADVAADRLAVFKLYLGMTLVAAIVILAASALQVRP